MSPMIIKIMRSHHMKSTNNKGHLKITYAWRSVYVHISKMEILAIILCSTVSRTKVMIFATQCKSAFKKTINQNVIALMRIVSL